MKLNAPLKALLTLAALLLLTGCVQFLQGDVVTFHEDTLPQGETIRIEAADPELADSLEFRTYARMVSAELRKLGYEPQEDSQASAATLIAEVEYSVQAGGAETRSSRHFPPYVRYHFHYGQFFDPYYFGFDNSWTEEVTTTPSYLRQLSMNIVRNDSMRTRLFEGRVRSSGRQGELAEVMPYLVTALFENFPGESGVTKVVTIEMDE
jgi:hypothetical protein